jgi:1A family penicillin-binding protein
MKAQSRTIRSTLRQVLDLTRGLRLRHALTRGLRLRHAFMAFAATVASIAGYLIYCIVTLPHDGGLVAEATPSALLVEANDGEVFASRGVFKGAKLSASDLPDDLVNAVVAIEDRRFHDHEGIDLRGMTRAAWRNIVSGRREGGSTITQQLARMLYLSPERTIKRKAQEALLALWLEHHLSKQEILVRYLNTAYFGAGVYGVDAAARRYFGKSAKKLALIECAILAGLVRAPSSLAPHRNLDAARERAETVLEAMVETGAVTRQQADEARQQSVNLWRPPETPPGTNYFVDTLNAEARRLIGGDPGDLRLTTTLDLRLQALAETVVAKRLATEGARRKVGQAALIALASDGAILAMVGGRDYEESQFNRAVQARRQPGSLFKLFVYLAALEKGYSPYDVMLDEPVQVGDWEPENYGGRYQGPITLRSAFARSINSVAVQLADEIGIKSVIELAKRLGVQSELPAVPSLALGSVEVTLMEMTRAFAAIAANAESLEPYAVRAIRDRSEQVIYSRPVAIPRPPADAAARRAILEFLSAVVQEGTGRGARLSGKQFGKTGTTQEHRDAWFVGFARDVTVGVWVGNDDNTPTRGVTGGSLPAAIWREFVSEAGRLGGGKAPAVVQARETPSTTGSAHRSAAPRGQASHGVEPDPTKERVVAPQQRDASSGASTRWRKHKTRCRDARGQRQRCRTITVREGNPLRWDDAVAERKASGKRNRSERAWRRRGGFDQMYGGDQPFGRRGVDPMYGGDPMFGRRGFDSMFTR